MFTNILLLQAAPPWSSFFHLFSPASHIDTSQWSWLDYILYGGGTFLAIWFISLVIRPKVAMKNWHHHFDNLQLSSEELYKSIIAEIQKRDLPKVKVSAAKYFEFGILSARRQCLRIELKELSIYVCGISFGEGYYISWWLHKEEASVVARIPILNDLVGMNPAYLSYYQLDTANLFQAGIHDAILKVIDEITEEKGLRLLTEFERHPQFINAMFKSK